MLDLIEDEVLFNWGIEDYVGDADEILSLLESIGMKPPGRWSSILRGDTAKREYERTSWEPEDD
jgi:hypothetical protein